MFFWGRGELPLRPSQRPVCFYPYFEDFLSKKFGPSWLRIAMNVINPPAPGKEDLHWMIARDCSKEGIQGHPSFLEILIKAS